MITVYRRSARGAECQSMPDLRSPSADDWQRWRPSIVARYKTIPARLFIRELEAEGLRVTVKILRDQFRRWGINDKNVRRNIQKHRHAYAATQDDRDVETRMCTSLDLPRETRSLHQALQSLQHWSDGSHGRGGPGTDVVADAIKFHDYLWDMKNAIRIFEAQRMCSATSVRHLNQASNRLFKFFKAACTPLAVLLSMQVILELRLSAKQNGLPWSEATSKFLLQVTTNHFVRSHPVSMLIHLLTFGNRDPHELATLYEAGRLFIERYLDKSLILRFRTSFFQTMLSLKLDTIFESEIEALCIEVSDPSEVLDGRVLCDLAHLRQQGSHLEQAERLARACLLAVQIHHDSRWIARRVLRTLASAQASMDNHDGAEKSLLEALQLTTIRQLDDASAPLVLSSSSMMVVDDLRQLYKHFGDKTKYDALCLSYPSAFGDDQ